MNSYYDYNYYFDGLQTEHVDYDYNLNQTNNYANSRRPSTNN